MFSAKRTPRLSSKTISSRFVSRKTNKRRKLSDQYQRLEQRLPLTTFVVNTLADGPLDDSTDGLISLREAIEAANTNSAIGDAPAGDADGDRIVFADGLFGSGSVQRSIPLTEGAFLIRDDLVIRGANIDAQLESRVFNVFAKERFNLRESTLVNGRANSGGMIYASSGSDVVLFKVSTFSGEAEFGGAVYSLASKLTAVESVFADGKATHGGAIFVTNGRANFIRSTFSSNEAQTGGAISTTGNAAIFSNSDFHSNQVDENSQGGAIYLGSMATANIYGGNFTNNVALDKLSGGGGAIFSTGTDLYITNTNFSGNEASRGGAIYVTKANTILRNVTLSNNASATMGGAIAFFDVSNVLINDSVIENNFADDFGGGISVFNENVESVFVVRDSNLSNNSSESSGGGVALLKTNARIFRSSINHNSADSGGGISSDNGYVFANSTTVANNVASQKGGGISGTSEFHLTDSFVRNNTATSAFAEGGGLYFAGDQYRRLFNTAVTDNSSSTGGGAHVSNGTMAAVNSRFASNTSKFEGGGVYVSANGRFNARATDFLANSSERGGGAFVRGFANIFESTFNFNDVRQTGGAATVAAEGRLFLGASYISENLSRGLGSAIEAAETSISRIDGVSFVKNTSVADPSFDGVISVGDRVTFHALLDSTFSDS